MDKSNMTNSNATGTDYSSNGNSDVNSDNGGTDNTAAIDSNTSNDDATNTASTTNNTATSNSDTPNDDANNTAAIDNNTPNNGAEKPKRHEKSLLERLKEKLWKMGLLVEDINNPTE